MKLTFSGMFIMVISLLDQLTTHSLFSKQCSQIVLVHYFYDSTMQVIDVDNLLNMEYAAGIWHGYDPDPDDNVPHYSFGGTYPEGESAGQIYTYSQVTPELIPCGGGFATAWRNLDGTITLFVFTDLELTNSKGQPCTRGDGSERCGHHHFEFGYVSAEEWQRVTGYVFSGDRDCPPDLDCMASA